MSASPLSTYERHVWRSFVAAARAWRETPRTRLADQLIRWARLAYSTPIPERDDEPWMRRVGRAVAAARKFADADHGWRETLWLDIAPALDRLGEAVGAEPAPAVPVAEARVPYCLRDT